MSDHPKLPDIVRLRDYFAEAKDAIEHIQGALRHRQQPQDVTFHRALKALRDGIDLSERLRSPAPAEAPDGARTPITDALADSQYLAGAKAGWNAAQADDPNAAYEAICRGRAGYLAAISRPSARPSVPAEDGEGLREALVRIEIITASGRTDELLGKMKTINSLAHSALSQGEK